MLRTVARPDFLYLQHSAGVIDWGAPWGKIQSGVQGITDQRSHRKKGCLRVAAPKVCPNPKMVNIRKGLAMEKALVETGELGGGLRGVFPPNSDSGRRAGN